MNTLLLDIPTPLLGTFIFLVGLCVGSFLNVCISRIPAKESVVYPASRCPRCGHTLAWWENIPIVSYIFLKGKCSGCKARISIQYPIVELLTGLVALWLWKRFGLGWEFVVYFIFSCSLIVVSFIDLEHKIIPDVISLPGIVLGFASSFLLPELSWLDSLLGIIFGGGILYLVTWGYYLVTKRIGMGGGDIKLLAMIGAFLGWQAIPFVIFISALTGSIIGIIFVALKGAGRHYQIPFGPFLALGAEIQLFWGHEIMAIYSHFLSFN
ncbi:MAG: prepilin peptidase [Thermodesulfobacteria bacterium]|nr:prepilin peptidase [Thermodesulfobacteriota bacterium]